MIYLFFKLNLLLSICYYPICTPNPFCSNLVLNIFYQLFKPGPKHFMVLKILHQLFQPSKQCGLKKGRVSHEGVLSSRVPLYHHY